MSRILIAEGLDTSLAEIDNQNKPLENALIRKVYSFKRALTVLK
ncbi:hypothetical protein QE109_01870 [Fusibacter bizertensis]|uniref:Transposase n=1 Tax=Fusibacter bizertensis TaxID=1488331 RepID=A0ABT6N8Y3_9FIRM|nr:hypothetical protein [Fusibacter bizertensis]MDH8676872.1 hypothetical protein [Fusibacter bizertensis]